MYTYMYMYIHDCFLIPFGNKSISLVLPTFYVLPFIWHSLISHEISNIPPIQSQWNPNAHKNQTGQLKRLWLVIESVQGLIQGQHTLQAFPYKNSCCPTSEGQTRICPPQFRVITKKLPHQHGQIAIQLDIYSNRQELAISVWISI